MKFKPGVSIMGLRREMYFAMDQVNIAAAVLGPYEATVTSAVDGKHSPTSLHYDGRAIDIRTRDQAVGEVVMFLAAIREHLPDDYDVVDEGSHIHIEWQPKYAG